MNTTVIATFTDLGDAERATGALMDHGIDASEISLVATKDSVTRYRALSGAENTENVITQEDDLEGKWGVTTTTPEDAASGATKGLGIGLGVGVIGALASIFIPGVGFVLGSGALALALGGAAAATGAGAVAGGIVGFLKDQGVPPESVTKYTHAFEQGGVVLSVTVPEGMSVLDIQGLLMKYNAQNSDGYKAAYVA